MKYIEGKGDICRNCVMLNVTGYFVVHYRGIHGKCSGDIVSAVCLLRDSVYSVTKS